MIDCGSMLDTRLLPEGAVCRTMLSVQCSECMSCVAQPVWIRQGKDQLPGLGKRQLLCNGWICSEFMHVTLCSLYGADKAKTNFPASEYASYFAMTANPMAAPSEPMANASQLVDELQQVVGCHLYIFVAENFQRGN